MSRLLSVFEEKGRHDLWEAKRGVRLCELWGTLIMLSAQSLQKCADCSHIASDTRLWELLIQHSPAFIENLSKVLKEGKLSFLFINNTFDCFIYLSPASINFTDLIIFRSHYFKEKVNVVKFYASVTVISWLKPALSSHLLGNAGVLPPGGSLQTLQSRLSWLPKQVSVIDWVSLENLREPSAAQVNLRSYSFMVEGWVLCRGKLTLQP